MKFKGKKSGKENLSLSSAKKGKRKLEDPLEREAFSDETNKRRKDAVTISSQSPCKQIATESNKKPKLELSILEKKARAIDYFTATALPMNIIGREKEKAEIIKFLLTGNALDQSKTYYICGKPGTGKTSVLNFILKNSQLAPTAKVHFMNAMTFHDIKSFMRKLDVDLCKERKVPHSDSYNIDVLSSSIQESLKLLNSPHIIVVDELDTFVNKTSDDITPIFQIPLFAPKTTLIGIANSTGFFIDVIKYYENFPVLKRAQIIFDAYNNKEIVEIIKGKIEECFSDKQTVEQLITDGALRYIGNKIGGTSGDIRVAFDTLRGSLIRDVEAKKEGPIEMSEAAAWMNKKYKSTTCSHIQSLPKTNQMIVAAIYMKSDATQKTVFKFSEIYEKYAFLNSQMGLSRPSFSEFSESLHVLEDYGIIKTEMLAKNPLGSILEITSQVQEIKEGLEEIEFFKDNLFSHHI